MQFTRSNLSVVFPPIGEVFQPKVSLQGLVRYTYWPNYSGVLRGKVWRTRYQAWVLCHCKKQISRQCHTLPPSPNHFQRFLLGYGSEPQKSFLRKVDNFSLFKQVRFFLDITTKERELWNRYSNSPAQHFSSLKTNSMTSFFHFNDDINTHISRLPGAGEA